MAESNIYCNVVMNLNEVNIVTYFVVGNFIYLRKGVKVTSLGLGFSIILCKLLQVTFTNYGTKA